MFSITGRRKKNRRGRILYKKTRREIRGRRSVLALTAYAQHPQPCKGAQVLPAAGSGVVQRYKEASMGLGSAIIVRRVACTAQKRQKKPPRTYPAKFESCATPGLLLYQPGSIEYWACKVSLHRVWGESHTGNLFFLQQGAVFPYDFMLFSYIDEHD